MAQTQVNLDLDTTSVTISSDVPTTVELTTDVTNISISAAIPSATFSAENISFTPYGGISSTNVGGALNELINQFYRSDDEPTDADEGDLWYDLDDDLLKAYVETTPGNTEWITLLQAGADDNMLLLDGGSF